MIKPFTAFPKLARLSRDCFITEKIDGTNASILIEQEGSEFDSSSIFRGEGLCMWAGSRTRWLHPIDGDNFGFAKWAQNNSEELLKLGPGHHFGEWWGFGIQRGYGLVEKRFSLFNASRWGEGSTLPGCCSVVPVIYSGMFRSEIVDQCLESLAHSGSSAAPGYMNPEGIVVYHSASRGMFKKTIKDDEKPKGSLEP